MCALAAAHALDLNRAIAIGHSSGGHLALWLAARAKPPATSELFRPDALELTGAINLDDPLDLADLLARQEAICGAPVVTELIGGSPQERPVPYTETAPIELLTIGVPHAFFAGQMFASQLPPHVGAPAMTRNPSWSRSFY